MPWWNSRSDATGIILSTMNRKSILTESDGRIVISLQVSEEFARMITANFLGIGEDQVKDDDIEDSMKELANMVGGAISRQDR